MILDNPTTRALPMPQLFDLESHSTATKPEEPKRGKAAGHKSASKHTTTHVTNYSEKSEGDKKEVKKKPKAAKKKATPKKASGGGTTDVDDNAVPNPAPDNAPTRTTLVISHTGGVYSGVLPVIPPSTTQSVATSGFSPLPPLAAFATSLSAVTVATSAHISSSVAAPSSTLGSIKSQPANKPPATKRLPTVSIILLVVGAVLVLGGLVAVIRVYMRPRKHKYPTPSRPVLQDPFQDKPKRDADEESLFGGKERSSTRPGSKEVLLNWTQYPHTSVIKPLPTLDVRGPQSGASPKRSSRELAQDGGFSFPGLTVTPAGNYGTRSPSRLSVVSASVYPGSPASTHAVGIAVGGSPLTADNLPLLQRSNTKSSARRLSQAARGGVRRSVIPSTYGTSDLYGATSPVPETPMPPASSKPTAAGRARVKAPYAPVSLIRTSTAAPAQMTSPVQESNPFEEASYILPPLTPVMKSEDRRLHDTKALAHALGLSSPGPVPPSPQTTLYPDDSITLAGDRRRSSRTRSQLMSPSMDAGARLGKLMMGDFQSTTSLAPVRNVPEPAGGARGKLIPRKRVEEKPPRVPSPPPMPSLAQMALAHNNPQDFEDYRSPTYSIYGLYDPDRKSKNPGEGGY